MGQDSFLGQGQQSRPKWVVKNLDPGRGCLYRVYGCDHPLYNYQNIGLQFLLIVSPAPRMFAMDGCG